MEELQEFTASDPLSLAEEYEMQEKWRLDADKLTFIVCNTQKLLDRNTAPAKAVPKIDDSADMMIGDVNLFLVSDDDDSDSSQGGVRTIIGEVEIMIANPNARGCGNGLAVLRLFLWYIWTYKQGILQECTGTSLAYLRVKINASNLPSIRLFERLGFAMASKEPNYFGEIEMRWTAEDVTPGLETIWQRYTDNSSTLLSYEDKAAT
jgi:hypothetical protein